MIPYSRQTIDNKDIKNINKVLLSNYLTQGPVVNQFESKFKKYVGSRFAVACSNATSGLYIACLAIGLKKNDLVWTTSNSFVASANCALMCGCKVDFLDINEADYNIDILKLKKKLEQSKKKPKAIINVHFAGLPSSQKEIYLLSKKYKFKIIEDASHALGASFKQQKVGNCKWSDLTIFSFHPVKPITTGEGGMITTNNSNYNDKIRILREHGILRSKKYKPWIYKQVALSLNFRMNEIQAALGISQLKKIDKFNKARNRIAEIYKKFFKNKKIKFQEIGSHLYSSYHLFVIKIKKRDKLFMKLREKNIFCQLHYIPIYHHPFYKFKKSKVIKSMNNSEEYFKQAISIPIYPGLKKEDQMKVIKLIDNHIS